MCILLKLDYAKFGVSNLFFQKLSKDLWGGLDSPPLVQEGLIYIVTTVYTVCCHLFSFE